MLLNKIYICSSGEWGGERDVADFKLLCKVGVEVIGYANHLTTVNLMFLTQ